MTLQAPPFHSTTELCEKLRLKMSAAFIIEVLKVPPNYSTVSRNGCYWDDRGLRRVREAIVAMMQKQIVESLIEAQSQSPQAPQDSAAGGNSQETGKPNESETLSGGVDAASTVAGAGG